MERDCYVRESREVISVQQQTPDHLEHMTGRGIMRPRGTDNDPFPVAKKVHSKRSLLYGRGLISEAIGSRGIMHPAGPRQKPREVEYEVIRRAWSICVRWLVQVRTALPSACRVVYNPAGRSRRAEKLGIPTLAQCFVITQALCLHYGFFRLLRRSLRLRRV